MIPWIRILLYFSSLALIIVRLKKKDIPLSGFELTAAFALKVILGCLYGYVHLRFYNGDDTWLYNTESITAYHKLKQTPRLFFTDFWPDELTSFHMFTEFLFRNLEHEVMIRLLALFNFFSSGNYYINTIFFNFFLFWGHYWLFSFLIRKYPAKRTMLLIGIFFIPPFIFWLSGIRGDGLVFLFLCLVFTQFDKWLTRKKASHLLFSFLAMMGVFLFRSAIVLVLVPFLSGWFISERFTNKPLLTFGLTYLFCCLFFFGSSLLHPGFNLPGIVVNKQHDFMNLPGKTRFAMEPLTPDFPSFLKGIPAAVENTFFRPYVWEAKGMLQVVTALETAAYLLFIIFMMPFISWQAFNKDPWLAGALLFSLSIFIFIGLTIPFPGAIIRYKAIPELLLMVCLLIASGRITKKKMF